MKVRCPVCAVELDQFYRCPEGHRVTSHVLDRATPLPLTNPHPIEDMRSWAQERVEHLDGRPVVVSVSGGKDSTATCLLLKEAEIPFSCVHMDTGWEHELTVEYVRDYLPSVVGSITVLRSHLGGMKDLVRYKAMFSSRVRRFCTQELKVRPFQRHLRKLQDAGEDPVNAIGIRRAESKARSEMSEWDMNAQFDCEVWRPLIHWTYQDVIDIHHRHGVKPNPLYLKGATRVGCWPCIFARKSEIRMLADLDPGRIDEIEALEAEVSAVAAERARARGDDPVPCFWFQNPRKRGNKAKGIFAGSSPIREVVEWARTKHGGKELDPNAPPYAEEGCMRWGLCETRPPEAEEKTY